MIDSQIVREAEPALNIYDNQAKEFIDCLEDDFYVQLLDYNNYWNRPFHTKTLNVLSLLSIAECYTLSRHNPGYIKTPLDIEAIISLVETRLRLAPKYGSRATSLLKGLTCYIKCEYRNTSDTIMGELAEGEDVDGSDSGLAFTSGKHSRFI